MDRQILVDANRDGFHQGQMVQNDPVPERLGHLESAADRPIVTMLA
jgi:hypothetical protein